MRLVEIIQVKQPAQCLLHRKCSIKEEDPERERDPNNIQKKKKKNQSALKATVHILKITEKHSSCVTNSYHSQIALVISAMT